MWGRGFPMPKPPRSPVRQCSDPPKNVELRQSLKNSTGFPKTQKPWGEKPQFPSLSNDNEAYWLVMEAPLVLICHLREAGSWGWKQKHTNMTSLREAVYPWDEARKRRPWDAAATFCLQWKNQKRQQLSCPPTYPHSFMQPCIIRSCMTVSIKVKLSYINEKIKKTLTW